MSGFVEIQQPPPWNNLYDLPDDVEHDATSCADCGAPIGPVLWADPETGHDRSAWVNLWRAPDGRLLCEDCTIDAEEAAQ